MWCCPTGNPADCCPQGEICSSDNNTCIPIGTCRINDDCLTPYFTCADYECVPSDACTFGSCDPGEFCSAAGGCIPDGRCVDHPDCDARRLLHAVAVLESLGWRWLDGAWHPPEVGP